MTVLTTGYTIVKSYKSQNAETKVVAFTLFMPDQNTGCWLTQFLILIGAVTNCICSTGKSAYNSNSQMFFFPYGTEKKTSHASLTVFVSTWHHAGQSSRPLPNKFPSERIVIPHIEPHQGDLWHLNTKNERLLPHGVETWMKSERKLLADG